jgi:hypothetical protein
MSSTNIYLRALSAVDVTDDYVGWFSDSVVREFLDSKNISKQDTIDYIELGVAENQY